MSENKFYNIVFDGKACENEFFAPYPSDMEALNSAWKKLKDQVYPPEDGRDLATYAKIELCGPAELDATVLAYIESDGNLSLEAH